MQRNNLLKVKTSFKTKITLIIFGFSLFFILLEVGLRLGGVILFSIQEYRNLQTIKQKGAYRIMCLGESTTSGEYPVFLEKILNQRNIGIKFSVVDKGISGINTTLILANLESNINNFNPDMVVTMMGINDSGSHVPCEVAANSKIMFFFKSLKTYKLARLLWLHLLVKAKEIGFYISSENSRGADETQIYLSNNGLKELCSKLIAIEESLKRGIQLNPKSYDAYFSLGLFYKVQGRFAEAENSFNKVLELNPKNDNAYLELGWLYRKQENLSKAEELWRKALELNPKSDLAYNALGWLYRKREKLIQAEGLLRKALELNPKSDLAYNALGWVYRKQEKLIQAEESFKKGLQFNPENANAYVGLGQLYQEEGKFAQAEELFNEALERNPKNDRARAAMSLLCKEMGKLELAKEYTKEADRLRLEYYRPVTVNNYRKLKTILDKKGIKFVCMQYPIRSMEPLRKVFEGNEKGIIFVDNEKVFKDALKKNCQAKYFRDMFGGDFGHCTTAGNRLLAENAANVILWEVFNDPTY